MTRRGCLGLAISPAVAAPGQVRDDLVDRMNRFARAYNAFGEVYRGGVFDLRGARRLSSLWREVEQSGQWPKPPRETR